MPSASESDASFFLVAPSDQGPVDLSVSWIECADGWIVMVEGGPSRKGIASAVVDLLRDHILRRGVPSSAGAVNGLWVASGGWMRGLWDDLTWWRALEATCSERGWMMERRDVLQDAYELFIVDGDRTDLGVLEIGLEGTIEARFTGAGCGEEEDFVRRVLKNWARYPEPNRSPQLMSPAPQPKLARAK
jgi:hypothetical protein